MKKAKAAGHYSPGVQFGNLVFTAGQLPVHPTTKAVPTSIIDQTILALEKVEKVLIAHGMDRNHILKTTAFITDGSYWSDVNEAYATFFGTHKPARSIIPCKSLNYGCAIEIEAIAGKEE